MGTSTDAILGWGVAWEFEGGLEDSDVEESIAKRFNVEIGSHCSGECPMPFVAVVIRKAWRGQVVTFDALPELPEDAEARVRGAVTALQEAYALEYTDVTDEEAKALAQEHYAMPETLSWFLVSDWC